MTRSSDIIPVATRLFFLPVKTRVPLKFGPETLTSVTVARVEMLVQDRQGRVATGWGETPLSVQWVWPSSLSYTKRYQELLDFSTLLASAWVTPAEPGHPIEVGYAFLEHQLPRLLAEHNAGQTEQEPMPWLAALVCCSAFDIALHDAFGNLLDMPVYQTYGPEHMNRDLSAFLRPARGSDVDFSGCYPARFLDPNPPTSLPAWHLVGGLDPLEEEELTGDEPDDGYPVLLGDWIARDGLSCLKVKLRGDDQDWDYDRLVGVGQIAGASGVLWLSADFNCTVGHPQYVNAILDRLLVEQPRLYGTILYVEQPFPYDLEAHRIDVHSVSARKPLFMDESAHDWRLVRLGHSLGWTGVALKTCKTQTGALMSLCWARAHGMTLMVQDLTNPMLAQISHVQLAAQAGTIMGVETNAMQFYPDASRPEQRVHPGLYRRRRGQVDLATIKGPGFGYRLAEIERTMPEAAVEAGWRL